MTTHDEIIQRMDDANPLPDVEMIADGQLAAMTLLVEEGRRTAQTPAKPVDLLPVRTKVRWLRPAVAFGSALLLALAVIGAVSLVTEDQQRVADQTSSTTLTTVATTTTVVSPSGEWNDVLATTLAGAAPAPAGCPIGIDPDTPGPADQERPVGSSDPMSAAFDRHAGRVIYVDEQRETWAFDVCTNTWTNLHPTGSPTGNISGGLVYDVDSDVTVSVEADEIFVYDAARNSWENRANVSAMGPGSEPVATAYDPISGLIVTSAPIPGQTDPDAWFIRAYDVDTDTWHDLGKIPLPRQTPCCTGIDLLGYSAELDRLVLTTYVDEDEATLLLDPRRGELSIHLTPTPVVNLGWPSRSYGQAETVYVQTDGRVENGRWNDVLCGFDPYEIAWSRCYPAPNGFPALKYDAFNAIVGDPINDRLLLLGGTSFSSTTSDAWAIDVATGEWTEILAPRKTQPATVEDQSGVASQSEWNSILATTFAGPTSQVATCPSVASPDEPGPANQERPTTVEDDHAGAFDRRAGQVIYVDTMQLTWAFDVCSNTWAILNAEGMPIDESLVYDADSDLTIALGPGDFSVYDATTNQWTRPLVEVVGEPAPESFWGVVYDPISGLVITTSDDRIWAYDVETSRLTQIGFVPRGSQLAGYVDSLDRLVFVADRKTILVNPRNGETTQAPAGELPVAGWALYDFFDAAGTVFIGAAVDGDGSGCGFNAGTMAWDLCYEVLSPRIESFASRIEDSINGRVVLIHSRDQNEIIDDVWAVDLATGEIIELLASSE